MLGRLRMSTKEALEQYRIIAGQIFSAKNRKWFMGDGAFKATTLEQEVKRVVAARMGRNENERMLDIPNQSGMGAAFVCTLSAIDMAHLRCFRTYKTRDNANANCEIWEAARATTAAPTFFKRIAIGEEG
ncbi:MAG: hypothetical protein M1840_004333 [Geoglossum simile]|nr:MAG: hypothetical protein M1840_004333 [Geoglossum simile]